MRLFNDIAVAQKLSQDDILKVVAEYEIDVSQAKEDTQYFNGNPSLPKSVLLSALDEIQGSEMQLQVSQVMHGLLSVESNTQKEEVFFVEHAVGYWGIGDAWRSWLTQQPAVES